MKKIWNQDNLKKNFKFFFFVAFSQYDILSNVAILLWKKKKTVKKENLEKNILGKKFGIFFWQENWIKKCWTKKIEKKLWKKFRKIFFSQFFFNIIFYQMLRYNCEKKGICKKRKQNKISWKKIRNFFFKIGWKKFLKMKIKKKVCEKFRNFFFFS